MDNTSSGELAGVGDLLGNAWEIYRGRMLSLVGVGLATAILPILSFAALFALGYVVSQLMPELKIGIMAISTVLAIAAMVWVANWAVSAFLTAIVDQQCGIKEAFKKAKPRVLGHIWLGVLTGLILTGAHLLLVIPGIIFTVWFFFAPFVFIDEDVRGMDALLKSKQYVKGRWFGVCFRLLAIWLVSVVVSAIPIIGQLLALFLIPFSFIYTFLIYKNLRATREDIPFQPTRKEKATIIATGTFGYAMPALMVFAFMGSMFLMPFSMLKATMTGQSPLLDVMERVDTQGSSKGKATFKINPIVPGNDTKTHIQSQDKNKGRLQPSQVALTFGQTKDLKVPEESVDKEAGKLRQTIEGCTKAIKLQPNDATAYHNRAVANYRLGNYQKAVEDLTSAIKFDPKNATAYYNRAIAYGSLGKHMQAIEDGIKAIELNPREAKVYVNRGVDYIAIGRSDRAVDDFNTAIELSSQDASAYYARGVAYHRLGSQEHALEDFRKAAQMGHKKAQEYLKSNRSEKNRILSNSLTFQPE